MPPKKKPVVKKSAKKKSPPPPPPPPLALAAEPEVILVPCLPEPVARNIVRGCLPSAANDAQTLGILFPLPGRRNAFCNCVKEAALAAGMNPVPPIPCDAATTIGDVVGALKC
jgi:hypothetical protein